MSILVLGSLNMDLVARVPHLPQPGETLLGDSWQTVAGGKGANQAVAAARLGRPTRLIGRVGDDGFGQTLLAGLAAAGVKTDAIAVDAARPTGIAMIAVTGSGENQIIVIPGANGAVGPAELERLATYLAQTQVLLLQFECPLAMVQRAAQTAHQAGITVIVDPAPVDGELPAAFYPLIDILTPNQVEASQLVGFRIEDAAAAVRAAQVLQQRGTSTVIIKLGEQGVVVASPTECFQRSAFVVSVVDTVAAGDAFNGGLAVALSEGQPLRQAVVWASAAAALSVMQPGAQPSLPTRQAVEAFLAAADNLEL
jgi:ribokinase